MVLSYRFGGGGFRVSFGDVEYYHRTMTQTNRSGEVLWYDVPYRGLL